VNNADWDGLWSREGDWYVREPAGIILYKTPFWGSTSFTLRRREAGAFVNAHARILINVIDARNYTLIELDEKNYNRFTVKNGNRVSEVKKPLRAQEGGVYSVILTLDQSRFSIRINDSFSDDGPHGNGRFGFEVDGKNRVSIANFRVIAR
jgi:hypothetical protein